MSGIPFALYNAFSETGFGGSPAGIIQQAANIDLDSRRRIAREIGAAATGFVSHVKHDEIDVQFFSTVAELPMCGHGTVCLMTRLVDLNIVRLSGSVVRCIQLNLPTSNARVELSRRDNNRLLVMLDVKTPQFRKDKIDFTKLVDILGIGTEDLCDNLPVETAVGDFIHLIVPLNGLNSMARIKPDFNAIIHFCHQHDIQTVAVFSTEVEVSGNTLHVRDFCPAVGVAESAAAGTTNAALSCYLIRHSLVDTDTNEPITIVAEQGMEINRPSSIQTIATMADNRISRLQAGGVATRVFDGQLYLPTSSA